MFFKVGGTRPTDPVGCLRLRYQQTSSLRLVYSTRTELNGSSSCAVNGKLSLECGSVQFLCCEQAFISIVVNIITISSAVSNSWISAAKRSGASPRLKTGVDNRRREVGNKTVPIQLAQCWPVPWPGRFQCQNINKSCLTLATSIYTEQMQMTKTLQRTTLQWIHPAEWCRMPAKRCRISTVRYAGSVIAGIVDVK